MTDQEDESLDLNLSSYTIKELNQVLKLSRTSLEHYEKLQADKAMFEKLREGDRMAFDMLLKQAQDDVQDILNEMDRRKKVKCEVRLASSPATQSPDGQVCDSQPGTRPETKASKHSGSPRGRDSSDSDSKNSPRSSGSE